MDFVGMSDQIAQHIRVRVAGERDAVLDGPALLRKLDRIDPSFRD